MVIPDSDAWFYHRSEVSHIAVYRSLLQRGNSSVAPLISEIVLDSSFLSLSPYSLILEFPANPERLYHIVVWYDLLIGVLVALQKAFFNLFSHGSESEWHRMNEIRNCLRPLLWPECLAESNIGCLPTNRSKKYLDGHWHHQTQVNNTFLVRLFLRDENNQYDINSIYWLPRSNSELVAG